MHQIGAGALGPVFRAYEPDQDRLVAVKLFKLDLPPERVHQLVAELEKLIAADLTHPSIAAPIAAGISGTSAYFAQDFVAADSLDIVVRDHGPAPASDALRVATQLGAALDFAAAVDVLHGSLHPRDVLVSSDDTRVIGLGFTKALERVGLTPPIRRPYTAPERASNGAWDRRADVFALGALIYEMLAGKRLATTAEYAGDTLTNVPGVDSSVLKSVFAKALADDPARRFGSALEFADALKSALTVASVAAPAKVDPSTVRETRGRPEPGRSAPGSASPRSDPRDETDVALPFEDPHPAAYAARSERGADSTGDGFDIGHVSDVKREPVDLPLHEDAERVIQLREDMPLDETPAAPLPAAMPAAAETIMSSAPVALSPPPARHEPANVEKLEISKPDVRPPAFGVKSEASRLPPEMPKPPARGPELDLKPEVRSPQLNLKSESRTPPTAFIDQGTDEFRQSALEKTRSAVWPLALAVGIGLVVGFAGGYGVAMRDRLLPSMNDTPVASATGAQAPAAPVAPSATSASPAAAGTAPAAAAPPPAAAPAPASAPPAVPAAPAKTDEAARPESAPVTTSGAARANGRLVVRSTPPGAKVSIDGRDAGTTPATVRDLSIGPHTVRVAEDGYAAGERRIVLTDERTSQAMRFELVKKAVPGAAPAPVAGPGGLMIESRPSGASVYIDGRLVGTTPMQIETVAAGDHTIGLAADGYQRWVGSVRVATGERARVTASLER